MYLNLMSEGQFEKYRVFMRCLLTWVGSAGISGLALFFNMIQIITSTALGYYGVIVILFYFETAIFAKIVLSFMEKRRLFRPIPGIPETKFSSLPLPPGPWALPLVGYIPLIPRGKKTYEHFHELAKTYGEFFLVKMGRTNVLILDSLDVANKAFKRPEFNDRPPTFSIKTVLEGGETSLLFASGSVWKFHRRLGAKALAVFAASQNSQFETSISSVVTWLIEKIGDSAGQPSSPMPLFITTGSVISSMLFGSVSHPSSAFFKKLNDISYVFGELLDNCTPLEYLPWLEIFYRKYSLGAQAAMKEFSGLIRRQMDEHVPQAEVRHIADALYKSARDTSDEDKRANGITDYDITNLSVDILDGGFFSASENLVWITLLLAEHPFVQFRLQKEVDSQVPEGRLPSVTDDMDSMPYTRAVVMESLRFASNNPFSLSHETSEDCEFRGCRIPKGTHVLASLWAINHHPAVFDEPFEFRPERFINQDGTFNQALTDKVVAFSVGKRRCLGEAIARKEIFMIIASLMQKFFVEIDGDTKGQPLYETRVGIFTMTPGDHQVIFRKRGAVKL